MAEFRALRAAKREQMNQFYTALLARTRALPGVESVAATSMLPMVGGGWRVLLSLENRPLEPGDQAPDVQARALTPGYFRTMGVPILQGRALSVFESRARYAAWHRTEVGERVNRPEVPRQTTEARSKECRIASTAGAW